VDGLVDGEPLYLSAVPIQGVTHNLLIVVTENDSVYAFDADTGGAIWHISTLGAGETPSDDRNWQPGGAGDWDYVHAVISRPAIEWGDLYGGHVEEYFFGRLLPAAACSGCDDGQRAYKGPVTITAK